MARRVFTYVQKDTVLQALAQLCSTLRRARTSATTRVIINSTRAISFTNARAHSRPTAVRKQAVSFSPSSNVTGTSRRCFVYVHTYVLRMVHTNSTKHALPWNETHWYRNTDFLCSNFNRCSPTVMCISTHVHPKVTQEI